MYAWCLFCALIIHICDIHNIIQIYYILLFLLKCNCYIIGTSYLNRYYNSFVSIKKIADVLAIGFANLVLNYIFVSTI